MGDEISFSDLLPNPKNPRKISDKKRKMLENALRKFGDLGGVVKNVKSGQLVGGHQRRNALEVLGASPNIHIERRYVPATKVGTVADGYINLNGERFAYREVDWSPEVETAANLAANKGAGEWDMAALGDMFVDLGSFDLDLDLTMFDANERDSLRKLPEAVPEVDGQDEAPEPPAHSSINRGDIFQIGRHRLMCGDSTSLTDVEAALGGDKADAVWTDPPYGISYVGKTKDSLTIENDGSEGLEDLLFGSLTNAAASCKPGAVWYVCSPPGPLCAQFAQILSKLEIFRQTMVWVKNSIVLGHSDFHYRHEIIFYGWTPGASHLQPADRKQDTVWECDRPTKSKEHPTMKPLALIERSLNTSTRPGELVFEPFGGSGSTMMACEKLGRRNVSIEIDPRYCQVIIDRAKLFGLEAERLEGGDVKS